MTAKLRLSSLVLPVLAAAAVGLLFVRGGKAPAVAATPKARVGLVFDVGGRGDKSFNDAAYLGLLRARERHGVAFELAEPLGAEDREGTLRLFAARGFDLVIGVGFIFSHDIRGVAKDFPGVRFACVDYAPSDAPQPENLLGLAFREEEGSFLVGAAAGLLSRSKHVGFVGGMTIPLIKKFEAGYRAGVRESCPTCEVHVAYAGTTGEAFRDPAKGKSLAKAQMAKGVDVLFHASGLTGQGVFEAAKEGSAFAIGVDRDQFDERPEVVATSMVKRVETVVEDTSRSVAEGGFRGGMRAYGLRELGVDWVHEGPSAKHLPKEVIEKVEALRARVVSGEIKVPTE